MHEGILIRALSDANIQYNDTFVIFNKCFYLCPTRTYCPERTTGSSTDVSASVVEVACGRRPTGPD